MLLQAIFHSSYQRRQDSHSASFPDGRSEVDSYGNFRKSTSSIIGARRAPSTWWEEGWRILREKAKHQYRHNS